MNQSTPISRLAQTFDALIVVVLVGGVLVTLYSLFT